MKHIAQVRLFETGTGLSAKCSCGFSLGRSTGCNRAGLWYAISALRSRILRHCQERNAIPYVDNRRVFEMLRDVAPEGDRSEIRLFEVTQ